MTGIGGQGVQVAVRTLARAAAANGLSVMVFGMFAGAVRGGRTECTLVVSDGEIDAAPIVPETWSAVGLHPRYFDTVARRVRDDGLVIVNGSLFDDVPPTALRVPIGGIAEECGSPALAGMVAVGAYAAASALCSLEGACAAMRHEIPSHRASRIPQNEAAIARGFEAVT